ncbi:thiazolylpeptide-type bacteriocin [Streptosporangium sp. NPDC000396]|uniref:thiazolylpeptide-type bacteriocin n=1 Tax=Streptosporangium sp. NPDC000396 TaxID=3366185 RepID=UPI003698CE4E
MPQIIDEFNLADLDLNDLTVVSMHDSAALPESGASIKSSSTCYVGQPGGRD